MELVVFFTIKPTIKFDFPSNKLLLILHLIYLLKLYQNKKENLLVAYDQEQITLRRILVSFLLHIVLIRTHFYQILSPSATTTILEDLPDSLLLL